MLRLKLTAEYSEDLNKLIANNVDLAPLNYVIGLLQNEKELNPIYKDHALRNRLSQYRECHIEDDWLLIYRVEHRVLHLITTGSHSDFFDK